MLEESRIGRMLEPKRREKGFFRRQKAKALPAQKRKAKVIGEVVSMSIKSTLNNPLTYAAGASVGLNQGLKYRGDFKAGTKAVAPGRAITFK